MSGYTVTAPEAWEGDFTTRAVFLAGGITGCPDWQGEAITMLPGVVTINPRRPDFPMDDPTAARAQIEWEFKHLHKADVQMFWFPARQEAGPHDHIPTPSQPIALYELGRHLAYAGSRVFVGCEPGYVREEDVRIQTELAHGGTTPVYGNLGELCWHVIDALR